MPDYTLAYWPLPFRGQFVRAVLAHVHASWDETATGAMIAEKNADPASQDVPHMGPPVLTDHSNGFSISQTAAILAYLGRKHGLMPEDPEREALTHKIVADANDVLGNMTRDNGAQMWTPDEWIAFQPRLRRWMRIFEETGRRHGLKAETGTMLGTEAPGIADLTTAVLWGTMTDKLPALRPTLEETAPLVAALCDRVAGLPEQVELRARSDADYGEEWCSGQIEESIRAML